MEWVLVAALAVFGWFQTERLNNAEAEADKWQAHAQTNYHEAQEAKAANDSNQRTITDLKIAGASCNSKLNEALEKIHRYQETGRIDRAAIDILRGQLAESNSRGDSDLCRVPDWVDIKNGLTAEGGN